MCERCLHSDSAFVSRGEWKKETKQIRDFHLFEDVNHTQLQQEQLDLSDIMNEQTVVSNVTSTCQQKLFHWKLMDWDKKKKNKQLFNVVNHAVKRTLLP